MSQLNFRRNFYEMKCFYKSRDLHIRLCQKNPDTIYRNIQTQYSVYYLCVENYKLSILA